MGRIETGTQLHQPAVEGIERPRVGGQRIEARPVERHRTARLGLGLPGLGRGLLRSTLELPDPERGGQGDDDEGEKVREPARPGAVIQ